MQRMMPRIHSARKAALCVVFGLLLFVPGSAVWAEAAASFRVASRAPMLAVAAALTLGGFALARALTSWWELDKLWKALRVPGVAMAAVGIFLGIIGVTEAPPVQGEGLAWVHAYDEGKQKARSETKPIMVDFTADWCGACQELEAEVFHSDAVRNRLNSEFVLVKVDLDEPNPGNQAAFKEFGFGGLPAVAFVSPDARYMAEPSFEGKLSIEEFTGRMDQALGSGSGGAGRDDEFARTLEEQGLLAALLLVFVAGLLSSLTPCVYPLIPITVSLFGAKQAESKLQAFLLSVVYVVGIAVTYSVLGVAAASLGTVFGGAMQSPWVLGAIAVLFFVLGLASLGAVPVRLPGNLQTKLSQTGGAGFMGAFVMGLVAGIIAAPCVGPIVAGILVYVAQQQDIFLGWILLMTFAFGMGQLFLALGTFSSLLNRLPRSGSWMDGVKVVFGTVFIAMALYYAKLLVPSIDAVVDALWLAIG